MNPRSVFSAYEYTPVAGFGADADSCPQGQVMYPTGQCGPAINVGTPCPAGMQEPYVGAGFCLGPGVPIPQLPTWGIPTQTTPSTPQLPEIPIPPSGALDPILVPTVPGGAAPAPVNVNVSSDSEKKDDWVVPVLVAGAGLVVLAAIFSTRR